MNQLSHMTWEEVASAVKRGIQTALLPIGATEQHGPHLGCGMDTAIAHTLCYDVAKDTDVFLLPTLPYGCSIGHSKRWPGTMALSPKTLIDVITDLGDTCAVGTIATIKPSCLARNISSAQRKGASLVT